MGLFDDYFDPDQFQDSGGLYGRLLSLHPESGSQSDDGTNPPGLIGAAAAAPAAAAPIFDPAQNAALSGNSTTPPSADANVSQPSSSYDLGAHLNAGFQKWAQTPAGNPFAALSNGIAGFNAVQPTDAAFIGPPAPPAQTPDIGDRLGAAFQSWAQTPVGSPFAALANGITGFNMGQSVAPTASPARPDQAQTPDSDARANTAIQNPPGASISSVNPLLRPRRPGVPRR